MDESPKDLIDVVDLTRFALARLKYLCLKSDSDALKLQAVKTLLNLPVVQERLGLMTQKLRELHQHVHIEAPSAVTERLVKLIEQHGAGQQAVLDAVLPTKTSSSPVKPNGLSETE